VNRATFKELFLYNKGEREVSGLHRLASFRADRYKGGSKKSRLKGMGERIIDEIKKKKGEKGHGEGSTPKKRTRFRGKKRSTNQGGKRKEEKSVCTNPRVGLGWESSSGWWGM